jgi:hypothetical protein
VTWTYSGEPTTSTRDELRFWDQDTQQDRPLLQDAECDYLLNLYLPRYESVVYVASIACTVIAARYAHVTSISADGVSISGSELQEKYLRMAEQYRELYKATGSTSLEPPLSASEISDIMFDLDKDFTIYPTFFGTGFMDNYRAGNQSYGWYEPSPWNLPSGVYDTTTESSP